MPTFRSLSTRLTVQFAALFAFAVVTMMLVASTLVSNSLSRQVERQLSASGAVFDRLWEQRAAELSGAGALLARDFGFREAVATGDDATMLSALDNLRGRARVDRAFIVSVDGQVHGLADARDRADAAALYDSLDSGRDRGVAMYRGRAYQHVAAPIMSPQLAGWLVLADAIDSRRMEGLERLSPIPIEAEVLVRTGGQWRNVIGQDLPSAPDRLDAAKGRSFEFETHGIDAIALAKPIPTLRSGVKAVLLLAYPKALALAQKRQLLWALTGMSVLGLLLVAFATWRAAERITRPLVRLDAAAARFAAGEHAEVAVSGEDELARMGRTFNAMVGEIEERERRITHLAFNDVLTGLPNRSMFHQHLEHMLRTTKPGEAIALHCLDLDHFKTINDTLGHPAGDALLVETAARLADHAHGHFVARLGGDEFVIVQQVPDDRGAIDRFARGVLERLSEALHLEQQQVVPSTSIGIAVYPSDGGDTLSLLKNADLALYRAKENGRGTFAFFEESLNRDAQRRRQIEADLRVALEQGQFELHYQPLFDLDSGRIASFEALVRWNHPSRGQVSPGEFIGIAEETGLIVQLGAWAVREACREAAGWPDGIRVAVNISSVQFHRPGLAEIVLQALAAAMLEPQRLEIEITESVFLEGSEATLAALHRLRGIGVRVALDDFGTGYSSLSYLQSFPFDKIKIDQSFIRNLLTRPGASAVVRAITDLASALGMETTAEGVEDPAQLQALREQGCSTVQGYLFARPLDRAAVAELLASRKGDAAAA